MFAVIKTGGKQYKVA
ncbi:MAG: 50S ribosomal protein L21, partial [Alphaproteobacteria bacterium]|nr:50S ribosomal protein L21 [Alphaproteobacteria bacterium]